MTDEFFRYILFLPKIRIILPKVKVADSKREQGQATMSTLVTTGQTLELSVYIQ
jgi:hypothetical protein